MIKNSFLNEKLNQRLRTKETPCILNHLFHCYFTQRKLSLFQRTLQIKSYLIYWNQKLLVNTTVSKVRTICFLTGRSRSVYRAFHMSRMKLREFASAGYFSGLSKASW